MNNDASEFALLEYLYRDAANLTSWGQILLKGTWTEQCQSEVFLSIPDGLFVAEQVGIPALYEELYQRSGGHRVADDHALHEFDCLRQATADEVRSGNLWESLEQLLLAYKRAAGRWDVQLSPHAA